MRIIAGGRIRRFFRGRCTPVELGDAVEGDKKSPLLVDDDKGTLALAHGTESIHDLAAVLPEFIANILKLKSSKEPALHHLVLILSQSDYSTFAVQNNGRLNGIERIKQLIGEAYREEAEEGSPPLRLEVYCDGSGQMPVEYHLKTGMLLLLARPNIFYPQNERPLGYIEVLDFTASESGEPCSHAFYPDQQHFTIGGSPWDNITLEGLPNGFLRFEKENTTIYPCLSVDKGIAPSSLLSENKSLQAVHLFPPAPVAEPDSKEKLLTHYWQHDYPEQKGKTWTALSTSSSFQPQSFSDMETILVYAIRQGGDLGKRPAPPVSNRGEEKKGRKEDGSIPTRPQRRKRKGSVAFTPPVPPVILRLTHLLIARPVPALPDYRIDVGREGDVMPRLDDEAALFSIQARESGFSVLPRHDDMQMRSKQGNTHALTKGKAVAISGDIRLEAADDFCFSITQASPAIRDLGFSLLLDIADSSYILKPDDDVELIGRDSYDCTRIYLPDDDEPGYEFSRLGTSRVHAAIGKQGGHWVMANLSQTYPSLILSEGGDVHKLDWQKNNSCPRCMALLKEAAFKEMAQALSQCPRCAKNYCRPLKNGDQLVIGCGLYRLNLP